MASSIRGVFRLASVLRTTAIRQRTFSTVSRWRHLAATASQQSKSLHQPHVTALRPVVPTRWFASGGPGLSVSELETRVLDVIKTFDKVDPQKVTRDANFINDLGLDSLDVVEIVMAFEDEFGVEIDDEQAEKIHTAGDAVEYLKREMDVH